jgi:hypothetical protein
VPDGLHVGHDLTRRTAGADRVDVKARREPAVLFGFDQTHAVRGRAIIAMSIGVAEAQAMDPARA